MITILYMYEPLPGCEPGAYWAEPCAIEFETFEDFAHQIATDPDFVATTHCDLLADLMHAVRLNHPALVRRMTQALAQHPATPTTTRALALLKGVSHNPYLVAYWAQQRANAAEEWAFDPDATT